jgi:long-chain acyl-CoA synthetase
MQGQRITYDMELTSPDDTAVLLYTSGTTGQPKGAELTHLNLLSAAMNFRDAVRATPDDVHLVALPLYHCYAQSAHMNAGFLTGASLVIMPRFDAGMMLRRMEEEDVTLFCGVPTMYWALLNRTDAREHDIEKISSTFRAGVSGGAPLSVEVLRAVEDKLKITILEAYGLTETAAATTHNRLDRPRKVGSIGIPHWGIQVRVVDEAMQDVPPGQPGELVIRGPCAMKGYCRRPEATVEAFRGGWFHTGDVAKRDEDGYFYIIDRLTDMIIRGGYNVYPREVEDRLMEHPEISLAAVIGVPDEQYGEEVRAYVVLQDGAPSSAEDVAAWSRTRMAAYKYPRQVKIVDSLPLSATGKILKRELRRMIAEESTGADPSAAREE